MPAALSVVVPAYNDQAGLDALLPELTRAAAALRAPCEVLVVDDGSDAPVADFPGVKRLRHRRNRGYGAAIKTGVRAAEGAFVLVMDADHQHDPAYLEAFFARARDCDMVVGERASQRTSPLWRRPGKRLLTLLLNALSPRPVRDINCGLRCFRREAILEVLDLCSDGFSFSLSSTVLMLDRGFDVRFEPVAVRPRIGASTVRLATGFQTVLLVVRLVVLTSPLRFFLPIGAALFAAGAAWTAPYVLRARGVSVGGLLLMIAGMLSFFFGVIAEQLAALLKRRP